MARVAYRGKEYEVLTFHAALKEFNNQKAKGVHKTIVSVQSGYIVADAIFVKEGGEQGGDHD